MGPRIGQIGCGAGETVVELAARSSPGGQSWASTQSAARATLRAYELESPDFRALAGRTRGVELALAGCSDAKGAAILGHRSPSRFRRQPTGSASPTLRPPVLRRCTNRRRTKTATAGATKVQRRGMPV
ncbi:MAG: hypothetical protein JWQ46_56 [Phenylobacterium sp.]|nr:hypothetical protein [Phenylobacterium sp.]